jgi:multicomponent Na+:H+ antiporter subunit D
MTASLPPFLIFFVAAGVIVALPARLRAPLMLAIPVIGVLNLLLLSDGDHFVFDMLGYKLTLVRVDKLSFLFGLLFHLAAFIGFVFALHVDDRVQQVASILYPGSALGAVFAGDMATLFVFWELLALTSVFLILAQRTERAYRASMRYLLMQVTSGLILLAGVIIRVGETGSIEFGYIGLAGLSSALIFLAMGIKCGFPFLHTWITDAYPEATPTGTVFLSAFTTKVGVYALARAFPGTELLVYIGAAMTMFPIFFAVIENDLRRVLAYSMINQVGFMVCGVGLGTALALNGAISHAFNDVIFKGLLFMSMGAVLYRTGRMNGSDLGGLYKSMPKTAALCIVGAASISAFPLFSGFVSKSMVMVAALEEGHPIVWLALLFASAGVFHHAGIKIPFFAFFAHDSGIRVKEAPMHMLVAMGIAAGLCIFIGVYPWLLYSLLPAPVDYAPYTAEHVLTQCQLLFFSALAFCWLKLSGLYPPELPSVNLDVDWIYRKALPAVAFAALRICVDVRNAAVKLGMAAVGSFGHHLYRHHGPEGILARTWPTGAMALWATLLLAAWLLFYYVQ